MQTAKITIEITANINDVNAILAKVNGTNTEVNVGSAESMAPPARKTRTRLRKPVVDLTDGDEATDDEGETSDIDMSSMKETVTDEDFDLEGSDEVDDEEQEAPKKATLADAINAIKKFNVKHGTDNARATLKRCGFVSSEALRTKGKTADFEKVVKAFAVKGK